MALTKTFQVFSSEEDDLHGNTSTVILAATISDERMQQIAADMCQPATTFLSKSGNNTYNVRWFAPDEEIELCGHGSMAAIAFLSEIEKSGEVFTLHSPGGIISGKRESANQVSIQLAAIPVLREIDVPAYLPKGLGTSIDAYYETSNKNIVLVSSEEAVKNLEPDFATLRESDTFAYVVTAPGSSVDFVSRTFVPHVRQLEDPATGSSHAILTPFWSNKLNKTKLNSLQLSDRGGKFLCEIANNLVTLTGEFKLIFDGKTII